MVISKLKNNPWISIYYGIKTRCENPKSKDYKNYGGRGIKNYLTINDIKFLYTRDSAENMKQPTIDRKDNNGNYELSNCEFIEKSENIAKRNKESWIKAVSQYSLSGKFIKTFHSIKKAGQELNIDRGDISRCVNNKIKTAGKFKWEFEAINEMV